MTTAPDQCCQVCGDGVPLSGPEPETVWHVCRSCLAEGWTGEAGDDVRRYIGAGPREPTSVGAEVRHLADDDTYGPCHECGSETDERHGTLALGAPSEGDSTLTITVAVCDECFATLTGRPTIL